MKLPIDDWNQCPVRYFAGLLGDKWSLIILRDLMFRGKHSFNSFKQSSEGISTNILPDRLKHLESIGVIDCQTHNEDGRAKYYQLTEKGWDLFPVMQSIFEWSYKHDENTYLSKESESCFRGSSQHLLDQYRKGKTLIFEQQ